MKQRLQISITIVLLSFLLIGCDFLQNLNTTEANEQTKTITTSDKSTTTITDLTTGTTVDVRTTQVTTESATTTETNTTVAPTTTQPTTKIPSTTTSPSFTISFEENGGSKVEDIVEVVGTIIVEPNDPVMEGYNFLGWYTDPDLNNKYEFIIMPENDLVLYAKWEAIIFTLSFNTNCDLTVEDMSEPFETEINLPDLDRVGYTFDGWFTDEELTNEIILSKMPPMNLTLYAKWTLNQYTVTFYNHDDEVVDYPQTVLYGESANPPMLEERFGYIFDGWSENYSIITSDIDIYPLYVIDSSDMTTSFTDPNLLIEVLNALGKETGEAFTKLDLLTIIDLTSSLEITCLDGIELLKNLEVLNLDNSPITDGTALSGLTNIKHLILKHPNFTNINFVENLTSLTFLVISFSLISDISVISNLVNLETLVITTSPVVDLSPLQNLNNLQSLLLSETAVSNLSPLFGISSLKSLNVAYTNVVDITGLSAMTNLIDLNLSGNFINSFEELEKMTQLETLFLYQTGFKTEDTVYVSKLINLKNLNLGNAMIYELDNLVMLPSTTTIRLWGFDTNPHIDGRYFAFQVFLSNIKEELETANSDIEKVLRVHDYINSISISDESAELSVIELLIEGRGMCSTYSNSTELLLYMLGIDATVIGGEGHAWNAVYLDGECYHMDGYWNEFYGYNYFMLSDNTIESYRSGSMFDWRSPNVAIPHPDLTCTSVRFEALAIFLDSFNGSMDDVYLLEDSIIYFDGTTNEIKKTDYSFSTTTILVSNVEKLLGVYGGKTMFYLSTLNESVYLGDVDGVVLGVYADLLMVKEASLIQNAIKVSAVDPYILTFNQSITAVDSSKIYFQDHLGNIVNANVTFDGNILTITPSESLKSQRAYELVLLAGAVGNSSTTATNQDISRYFFTETIPEPYQFTITYPTDGNLEYFQYYSPSNADDMNLFVLSNQPLEINYEGSRNITLSDSEGNIIMAQISVRTNNSFEWKLYISRGDDLLEIGETYTVTIPYDFFKSKIGGSFAAEDFITTVTIVDKVAN